MEEPLNPRLSPDTLAALDSDVQVPGYEIDDVRPGIVHLGLGAFHRAHMAMYTDKAIAVSGGSWRIIGVSMRSSAVAEQLKPQGCLYSVLSEDVQGPQLRVIGALQDVLVAPQDPEAVVNAIADASIHIVSLTITEKGYALADDGRSLNGYDDAIAADLANPTQPRSAIGLLALGLERRMSTSAAPLTVMSCDNVSENSRVLRGVLAQYLQRTALEVIAWMDEHVTFPCTMVDRIVPASTPVQRDRQAQLLGAHDAAALATEPFHQWFIENDFATARPDWEAAGAQVVFDVAPYERIKLGLLNAAHTAIAHYGLLAGLQTVDAVMSDEKLGAVIASLMDEDLIPALNVPSGFDMAAYRNALVERFSNPVLDHRCEQIAQDSTEKIAQRWLPLLAQSDAPPPQLIKALAVWVHLVLNTEVPLIDAKAKILDAIRKKPAELGLRIVSVLETARITSTSVPAFQDCCQEIRRYIETIEQ